MQVANQSCKLWTEKKVRHAKSQPICNCKLFQNVNCDNEPLDQRKKSDRFQLQGQLQVSADKKQGKRKRNKYEKLDSPGMRPLTNKHTHT
jgi:hypothetical protein